MGESRAMEAAEAEVLCVELLLLLLDIAAANADAAEDDDDAASGAGECRDVLIERAGTEEDPTDVMVRIIYCRSRWILCAVCWGERNTRTRYFWRPSAATRRRERCEKEKEQGQTFFRLSDVILANSSVMMSSCSRELLSHQERHRRSTHRRRSESPAK